MNCVTYKPRNNILDLIYPSPNSLTKQCTFTDKTYVFFMTLARCLIFGILLWILIENKSNVYLISFIAIYVVINIIILGYIIWKQPKYDTPDLSNIINIDQTVNSDILYNRSSNMGDLYLE